jgi:hypothetical protein
MTDYERGLKERLVMRHMIDATGDEDYSARYINPDGPEALARIEQLEEALRELVRRFDRRDWVLSGDDSKALHYARQALTTNSPPPE